MLNWILSRKILRNLKEIAHSQICMKMSSAKGPPFSVVLNVVMPYLNEHSLKVNGWMHEWNFPRIQTIMGVKTDGNGYELIITLRRNIDHTYFIN